MVVFDLDDTVYLERDFVLSGFRAASAWFEQQTGRTGLDAVCCELFAVGCRELIFDAALQALGIVPTVETVDALVHVYRTHAPKIALAPDALRFFVSHEGRCSFALITDGFATTQRNKIRALCLERFFRFIVCTDEIGKEFWKPHHRAFEEVESWCGRHGGDMVYVADNPAKDFLAPRALGWWTVEIGRPERVHQHTMTNAAHCRISTFDELEAGLNSLSPLLIVRRADD